MKDRDGDRSQLLGSLADAIKDRLSRGLRFPVGALGVQHSTVV